MAGGVPPGTILGDLVTTKRRANDGTSINLRPILERDGIDPGEFWPSAIDAAFKRAVVLEVDPRNALLAAEQGVEGRYRAAIRE